jgi:hypothetical protein
MNQVYCLIQPPFFLVNGLSLSSVGIFFNFPIYLQSVHIFVHSSNGVIKLAWRGALSSTPPYEPGTMPMLAAGKRKPYKL